ncbi:hypothetical protein AM506_17205 [Rossellomorea vietnamensis]|uniref:Uncharacterized protein n=1 Tax=Rossellomorea vietnamensis TaxID=218284 RepID=A0A0P6VUR5_9BACI|nr:hypothetical protein AM506_17205 [Rossellomorea vietnamensis]
MGTVPALFFLLRAMGTGPLARLQGDEWWKHQMFVRGDIKGIRSIVILFIGEKGSMRTVPMLLIKEDVFV